MVFRLITWGVVLALSITEVKANSRCEMFSLGKLITISTKYLSNWGYRAFSLVRPNLNSYGLFAGEVPLKSGWVNKPIPGLYDSIPTAALIETTSLRIVTREGPESNRFSTEIYSNLSSMERQVLLATVSRSFFEDSSTIKLNHSVLKSVVDLSPRAPKFIQLPGVISLVDGKGVPTNLFITLMQMKMANIQYGSLRSLSTNITNLQAKLEILHQSSVWNWLQKNKSATTIPAELIEGALPSTQSGRYIETLLTQSGHQIECWHVRGPVFLRPLEQVMDQITILTPDLGTLLYERVGNGKTRPLRKTSRIPMAIEVEVKIRPIPVLY